MTGIIAACIIALALSVMTLAAIQKNN